MHTCNHFRSLLPVIHYCRIGSVIFGDKEKTAMYYVHGSLEYLKAWSPFSEIYDLQNYVLDTRIYTQVIVHQKSVLYRKYFKAGARIKDGFYSKRPLMDLRLFT